MGWPSRWRALEERRRRRRGRRQVAPRRQRPTATFLKQNLFTLRSLIDEYTFDKEKAPQALQDLVTEGYLRDLPLDPLTKKRDTWNVDMEDAMRSVDQKEPGIIDVHSGSDLTSLDGSKYSEW